MQDCCRNCVIRCNCGFHAAGQSSNVAIVICSRLSCGSMQCHVSGRRLCASCCQGLGDLLLGPLPDPFVDDVTCSERCIDNLGLALPSGGPARSGLVPISIRSHQAWLQSVQGQRAKRRRQGLGRCRTRLGVALDQAEAGHLRPGARREWLSQKEDLGFTGQGRSSCGRAWTCGFSRKHSCSMP